MTRLGIYCSEGKKFYGGLFTKAAVSLFNIGILGETNWWQ